jgi:dienelactone hydrolase
MGLASAAFAQPTLESLGKRGSYQVAYYSQLPPKDEYAAATLYFPANRGTDFGGVVISPGYTEVQENLAWWGQHLASWGYAVLIVDTNTTQDNPQLRADALMAAIETVRGEGVRAGSPIRGKILDNNMAVMGHSMGGGGALLAANAHSDQIKAAIPFTPWLPNGDFSEVAVPTLVLAGEDDQIAKVAEHAWPHYQSLADDIPRMYAEVADGNHFIANSVTENEGLRPNIDVQDLVGALAVAWLKLYVDGDEDYRAVLYGEWSAEQSARLSRLERVE